MPYSNLAGVQFKRAEKIYHFTVKDHMSVLIGDMVVVDTDRGLSLAQVVKLTWTEGDDKKKPVVRKATAGDLREGRIAPVEAGDFVRKKIKELELNMRVLKVEVQFSGNKALVYFSAPGRVDFRKLVKELATGLRLRVELKQVGPRNETKLLGGIGVCGREYCCSSFLREFLPVSTRMAKNQNLALNPSKVSGGCGRLLCCLKYENENYSALRRKLPEKGSRVLIKSQDITGTVAKVDLLNETLLVEGEDGNRATASYSDIKVLERPLKSKKAGDTSDDWGDDLDLKELID